MSSCDRDGWPGVARQRVEVLPDGHDLGAVPDLVAHAEEDVLDLAPDLRQQVQPPARDRRAGDRHVDPAVGCGLVGDPQQLVLARERRLPRAGRGSPFRSIPLSRSRTPRSACASSDFRPRYGRARRRARSGGGRSRSALPVRTRSRLGHRGETIQVPPSFRREVDQAPVRRRNALRRVPGCAPGPAKERQ